MPVSKMFVGRLIHRDLDDTGEVIDWLAFRRREQDVTRSFRRPKHIAAGTRGASDDEALAPPRPQFARSESTADEMRLEAFEVLLENDASQPAPLETMEKNTEEDQDWDDYTLVEVALFLQPAW